MFKRTSTHFSLHRRQTLIALKEKSQKSRTPSINNSPVSMKSNRRSSIIPESISDEELHEEIQVEKPPHNRSSVERLDTQVSSLHQDVATLSIEVRNAIQALQEMAYTTLTSMDHHVSTNRSIPNLQNGVVGMSTTQEYLTRSSSQPAEIWHRSNPQISSVSDLIW
jgi:potassium voltage-gated channel Eag-related subfamily H member 8